MKYLSLFTGIGGLESEKGAPILCCELDSACHAVLRRRFGGDLIVHPDVTTLHPPAAEVIAGGWPCQDISVAGFRRGLAGKRSGLFFELVRVALEAGAHTIIAENVPNLLVMENGQTFRHVLDALGREPGKNDRPAFPYIAWRRLNARQFGLPHHRERVFIVASQHREIALALHRPLPQIGTRDPDPFAAGFYWTAGLQSICYSHGFVPTLKVGSSLSIPSPPALHFGNVVRKATANECLAFQGFDTSAFAGIPAKDIYRMTGNAVAAPVGRWVFGSLEGQAPTPSFRLAQLRLFGDPSGLGQLDNHGFWERGVPRAIDHPPVPLASNLVDMIDLGDRSMLSPRAAAGLLARLQRSKKDCPPDLRELLAACAGPARTLSPRDLDDDAGPDDSFLEDQQLQALLF